MRISYVVDPLLSANLAYVATIREEHILSAQIGYLALAFNERIKDLDRRELAYLRLILLDKYSKQTSKNYFIKSLLVVIEERLKKR